MAERILDDDLVDLAEENKDGDENPKEHETPKDVEDDRTPKGEDVAPKGEEENDVSLMT